MQKPIRFSKSRIYNYPYYAYNDSSNIMIDENRGMTYFFYDNLFRLSGSNDLVTNNDNSIYFECNCGGAILLEELFTDHLCSDCNDGDLIVIDLEFPIYSWKNFSD